ncbi:hypothetical protein O6H91_20G040900 [Diphasiastrum complanatum]|uniref:Uncharacterized protein n=1 Tax=Diphasiastrum complanatum TaxID=34168 RepID=A0ACC2APM6_DIPCM|nr:hypothetical protein O6H91_20G040900 [Diphasiastrum complanatum]
MKCFRFRVSESKGTSSKRRKCLLWPSICIKGTPSQVEPKSETSRKGSRTQSASAASSTLTSQSISFAASTNNSSSFEGYSQKHYKLRFFSFSELQIATSNFNQENFLGEGGFGRVYKGLITQRDVNKGDITLDVAVKRLNTKGLQGYKEWLSEIKYLGRVDHPNLVKLLGYCAEDSDTGVQLLIVYEFMPNKTLETHLFRKDLPVLSWQTRLNIALGAAKGLVYLHEALDFKIIYRDLKPSNILLDKDFMPKLSDFGLAREGPDPGHTHVSTVVAGTMGYAAPEYLQTGHLTLKCDIWSFGVVLLELLTGRKALDDNLPKNEQYLTDWSKPYINDNRKVKKIMDPRLEGQYSLEAAQRIASLACQCVSVNAKLRPKMREVIEAVKEISELPHS